MEKNKQREYQDVTEKLKTLRGLAEEDISEVGLLKCRIEQQAELICILKQRADEYLKKYMEIEDKTANIQTGMADFATKYDEEKKNHDVLKGRFETLDKNHVEMIKLKDEYKKENDKLRKNNEKLKYANENLFSDSITEKKNVISKMNEDLQELQCNLDQASKREKDLEKMLEEIKKEAEKDIIDLKCALDDEKSRNKEKLEQIEQKFGLAETEVTSLKNALEESNRKFKMQEETREFHEQRYLDFQRQAEDLVKQLDAEKEKVKMLEQKLKKEVEATSTNSTIRRLSAEVQEANQLKTKLIREFEAYKKHTSNLLNRERELNAKLRRLNIP